MHFAPRSFAREHVAWLRASIAFFNVNFEFFENSIVCEPADPEAKILEKVASRNNSIVRTYNKKPKNDLSNVVNEKNQRTFAGRVENFSDKLKNIPWT